MSHWHLIFRPEGDGPPVECRIRRLLKAALRCYGLRCIGYGPDETPRHSPQDARSEGGMTRKPSEASERATSGGKAGDRQLLLDPANLQSLCAFHHNRKTARQDGGFGRDRPKGDRG